MALKVNYLKNITRSLVFTAADIGNELAPDVSNFIKGNKDILKVTYAKIKVPPATARRRMAGFLSSKIFQPMDSAWKNIKSDLRSGDIYSKRREESGSDFNFDDLSDYGIESNWEEKLESSSNGDLSGSKVVTAGDMKLANTIEGAVSSSAASTINSIISSTENNIRNMRANTAMLYEQNERIFGGTHRDLQVTNNTLTAIFELQKKVITNMDVNLSRYQTEHLKAVSETNELLKKILSNQTKMITTAEEKRIKTLEDNNKFNREMRFSDITTGGLNLSNYLKQVKQNAVNQLGLLGLLFDDTGMLNGPIFQAFKEAPFRELLKYGMKSMIPTNIKSGIKDFNNTFKGLFAQMITNANRRKNKYAISLPELLLNNIIGLFGLNTNFNKELDTSVYEKGAIAWDGISRKALTNVIPGYLRRIEAVLTGRGEIDYDYNNGKWIHLRKVKENYDRYEKYQIDDVTRDIMEELSSGFIKAQRELREDLGQTISEFKQAQEEFKKFLFKNNGNFNTDKHSTMSDDDIQDFPILNKYFELIKDVYDKYDKDERNKYRRSGTKMALSADIIAIKDEMERHYRELESKSESSLTKLFEYAEKYNPESLNLDEHMSKLAITSGTSILTIKDKYGNSMHDYLYNINNELISLHKDLFNKSSSFGSKKLLKSTQYKEIAPSQPKIKEEKLQEYSSDIYDDVISSSVYKTIEEKQKPFLQKILEKTKIGKATTSVLYGIGDKITDSLYITDRWIYNLVFKKHFREDGSEYNGFLEFLIGKTSNVFKDFSSMINKNLIEPLKEKMGLSKDFTNRFKQSAKNTFFDILSVIGGVLNRRIINPVLDFGMDYKDFRGLLRTISPSLYNQRLSASSSDFFRNKLSEEEQKLYREEAKKALKSKETLKARMYSIGFRGSLQAKIKRLKEYGLDEKTINQALAGLKTNEEKEYVLDQLYYQEDIRKHAIGTASTPYMGKSYLSKGELLFDGNGGISEVRKTGLYDIKQPTHIMSAKDSYDFTKSVGLPHHAARTPVSSALADEHRVEKQLLGTHYAKGTLGKIQDFLSQDNIQNSINIIKKNAPEILGTSTIGGITYGLLGLAGGPLVGASIVAGASIINKSDILKNALFGAVGEDGKYTPGIISKDIQNAFRKYAPDVIDYSILGGLGSLILPYGPLAGILMGATIGFAKNNEDIRKRLFGDTILTKDKEVLKKILPRGLTGALSGIASGFLLGGPFGIVGNAAIGSAIGIISSADEFQTLLFGQKGSDNRRSGGLFNIIKEAFKPLTEAGKDLGDKILKATEENIIRPFKDFSIPLIHALPKIIAFIPEKINNWLDKGFGVGLDTILERYLVNPIKSLFRPIGKITGGIFRLITSPLKIFGYLGNKIREGQLRNLDAEYMGTAADRLAWRTARGQKIDEKTDIDTYLAALTLDQAKSMSSTISRIIDSREKLNKQRIQKNADIINRLKSFRAPNGAKISAKTIMRISKAINEDRIGDIPNILTSLPLDGSDHGLTREQLNSIMEDGLNTDIKLYTDINTRYNNSLQYSDDSRRNARKQLQRKLRGTALENIDISDTEYLNRLKKYYDIEIAHKEKAINVDGVPMTELQATGDIAKNIRQITKILSNLAGISERYEDDGTRYTRSMARSRNRSIDRSIKSELSNLRTLGRQNRKALPKWFRDQLNEDEINLIESRTKDPLLWRLMNGTADKTTGLIGGLAHGALGLIGTGANIALSPLRLFGYRPNIKDNFIWDSAHGLINLAESGIGGIGHGITGIIRRGSNLAGDIAHIGTLGYINTGYNARRRSRSTNEIIDKYNIMKINRNIKFSKDAIDYISSLTDTNANYIKRVLNNPNISRFLSGKELSAEDLKYIASMNSHDIRELSNILAVSNRTKRSREYDSIQSIESIIENPNQNVSLFRPTKHAEGTIIPIYPHHAKGNVKEPEDFNRSQKYQIKQPGILGMLGRSLLQTYLSITSLNLLGFNGLGTPKSNKLMDQLTALPLIRQHLWIYDNLIKTPLTYISDKLITLGSFIGSIMPKGFTEAAGFLVNKAWSGIKDFGHLLVDPGLWGKIGNFISSGNNTLGSLGSMLSMPILGAGIYAATSLISKSESLSKRLLGDIDPKTGKRSVINVINKLLPKTALFGTIGSIIGNVIPSIGPFGGLLVGSALGFASNLDSLKNLLFGDFDPKNRKYDRLPKVLRGLVVSGGTILTSYIMKNLSNWNNGLASSPLGMIGLVTSGLLGLFSASQLGTELLLGKIDSDGKRHGGLLTNILQIHNTIKGKLPSKKIFDSTREDEARFQFIRKDSKLHDLITNTNLNNETIGKLKERNITNDIVSKMGQNGFLTRTLMYRYALPFILTNLGFNATNIGVIPNMIISALTPMLFSFDSVKNLLIGDAKVDVNNHDPRYQFMHNILPRIVRGSGIALGTTKILKNLALNKSMPTAVGAVLGLVSTTDIFTNLVLGKTGIDGKRHGGIAGYLKTVNINISDSLNNVFDFVLNSVKLAGQTLIEKILSPSGHFINNIYISGKNLLSDTWKNIFAPMGHVIGFSVKEGLNYIFGDKFNEFQEKAIKFYDTNSGLITRFLNRFSNWPKMLLDLPRWLLTGGFLTGITNKVFRNEFLRRFDTSNMTASEIVQMSDRGALGKRSGSLSEAYRHAAATESGNINEINRSIEIRDSLSEILERRKIGKVRLLDYLKKLERDLQIYVDNDLMSRNEKNSILQMIRTGKDNNGNSINPQDISNLVQDIINNNRVDKNRQSYNLSYNELKKRMNAGEPLSFAERAFMYRYEHGSRIDKDMERRLFRDLSHRFSNDSNEFQEISQIINLNNRFASHPGEFLPYPVVQDLLQNITEKGLDLNNDSLLQKYLNMYSNSISIGLENANKTELLLSENNQNVKSIKDAVMGLSQNGIKISEEQLAPLYVFLRSAESANQYSTYRQEVDKKIYDTVLANFMDIINRDRLNGSNDATLFLSALRQLDTNNPVMNNKKLGNLRINVPENDQTRPIIGLINNAIQSFVKSKTFDTDVKSDLIENQFGFTPAAFNNALNETNLSREEVQILNNSDLNLTAIGSKYRQRVLQVQQELVQLRYQYREFLISIRNSQGVRVFNDDFIDNKVFALIDSAQDRIVRDAIRTPNNFINQYQIDNIINNLQSDINDLLTQEIDRLQYNDNLHVLKRDTDGNDILESHSDNTIKRYSNILLNRMNRTYFSSEENEYFRELQSRLESMGKDSDQITEVLTAVRSVLEDASDHTLRSRQYTFNMDNSSAAMIELFTKLRPLINALYTNLPYSWTSEHPQEQFMQDIIAPILLQAARNKGIAPEWENNNYNIANLQNLPKDVRDSLMSLISNPEVSRSTIHKITSDFAKIKIGDKFNKEQSKVEKLIRENYDSIKTPDDVIRMVREKKIDVPEDRVRLLYEKVRDIYSTPGITQLKNSTINQISKLPMEDPSIRLLRSIDYSVKGIWSSIDPNNASKMPNIVNDEGAKALDRSIKAMHHKEDLDTFKKELRSRKLDNNHIDKIMKSIQSDDINTQALSEMFNLLGITLESDGSLSEENRELLYRFYNLKRNNTTIRYPTITTRSIQNRNINKGNITDRNIQKLLRNQQIRTDILETLKSVFGYQVSEDIAKRRKNFTKVLNNNATILPQITRQTIEEIINNPSILLELAPGLFRNQNIQEFYNINGTRNGLNAINENALRSLIANLIQMGNLDQYRESSVRDIISALPEFMATDNVNRKQNSKKIYEDKAFENIYKQAQENFRQSLHRPLDPTNLKDQETIRQILKDHPEYIFRLALYRKRIIQQDNTPITDEDIQETRAEIFNRNLGGNILLRERSTIQNGTNIDTLLDTVNNSEELINLLLSTNRGIKYTSNADRVKSLKKATTQARTQLYGQESRFIEALNHIDGFNNNKLDNINSSIGNILIPQQIQSINYIPNFESIITSLNDVQNAIISAIDNNIKDYTFKIDHIDTNIVNIIRTITEVKNGIISAINNIIIPEQIQPIDYTLNIDTIKTTIDDISAKINKLMPYIVKSTNDKIISDQTILNVLYTLQNNNTLDKNQRLTQLQIANRYGISQSSVSRINTGKDRFSKFNPTGNVTDINLRNYIPLESRLILNSLDNIIDILKNIGNKSLNNNITENSNNNEITKPSQVQEFLAPKNREVKNDKPKGVSGKDILTVLEILAPENGEVNDKLLDELSDEGIHLLSDVLAPENEKVKNDKPKGVSGKDIRIISEFLVSKNREVKNDKPREVSDKDLFIISEFLSPKNGEVNGKLLDELSDEGLHLLSRISASKNREVKNDKPDEVSDKDDEVLSESMKIPDGKLKPTRTVIYKVNDGERQIIKKKEGPPEIPILDELIRAISSGIRITETLSEQALKKDNEKTDNEEKLKHAAKGTFDDFYKIGNIISGTETEKIIITKYGIVKYIKKSDGSWEPDLSDNKTKENIDRLNKDQEIIDKEEKDQKKEDSILKKIISSLGQNTTGVVKSGFSWLKNSGGVLGLGTKLLLFGALSNSGVLESIYQGLKPVGNYLITNLIPSIGNWFTETAIPLITKQMYNVFSWGLSKLPEILTGAYQLISNLNKTILTGYGKVWQNISNTPSTRTINEQNPNLKITASDGKTYTNDQVIKAIKDPNNTTKFYANNGNELYLNKENKLEYNTGYNAYGNTSQIIRSVTDTTVHAIASTTISGNLAKSISYLTLLGPRILQFVGKILNWTGIGAIIGGPLKAIGCSIEQLLTFLGKHLGNFLSKSAREIAMRAANNAFFSAVQGAISFLKTAAPYLYIADFVIGSDQAEALLGVKETNIFETFACGIANVVSKFLGIFSIIPNFSSKVARFMLDTIYSINPNWKNDYNYRKEETKQYYQAYLDYGRAKLSFEDWLRVQYSETGKFTSFEGWNAIFNGDNTSIKEIAHRIVWVFTKAKYNKDEDFLHMYGQYANYENASKLQAMIDKGNLYAYEVYCRLVLLLEVDIFTGIKITLNTAKAIENNYRKYISSKFRDDPLKIETEKAKWDSELKSKIDIINKNNKSLDAIKELQNLDSDNTRQRVKNIVESSLTNAFKIQWIYTNNLSDAQFLIQYYGDDKLKAKFAQELTIALYNYDEISPKIFEIAYRIALCAKLDPLTQKTLDFNNNEDKKIYKAYRYLYNRFVLNIVYDGENNNIVTEDLMRIINSGNSILFGTWDDKDIKRIAENDKDSIQLRKLHALNKQLGVKRVGIFDNAINMDPAKAIEALEAWLLDHPETASEIRLLINNANTTQEPDYNKGTGILHRFGLGNKFGRLRDNDNKFDLPINGVVTTFKNVTGSEDVTNIKKLNVENAEFQESAVDKITLDSTNKDKDNILFALSTELKSGLDTLLTNNLAESEKIKIGLEEKNLEINKSTQGVIEDLLHGRYRSTGGQWTIDENGIPRFNVNIKDDQKFNTDLLPKTFYYGLQDKLLIDAPKALYSMVGNTTTLVKDNLKNILGEERYEALSEDVNKLTEIATQLVQQPLDSINKGIRTGIAIATDKLETIMPGSKQELENIKDYAILGYKYITSTSLSQMGSDTLKYLSQTSLGKNISNATDRTGYIIGKGYEAIKDRASDKIKDSDLYKYFFDKNNDTDESKYGRGFSKQIDPLIANLPYTRKGDKESQTIGDSGCGPAAAANVLEAYGMGTSNYGRGVSDVITAANYMVNSKEIDGGTPPTSMQSYLNSQGISSKIIQNKNDILKSLESGRPTILMGKDKNGTSGYSPFGKNPHYVTATGVDHTGNIIVQDPESPYENLLYNKNKLASLSSLAISSTGRGKYGRGVFNFNDSKNTINLDEYSIDQPQSITRDFYRNQLSYNKERFLTLVGRDIDLNIDELLRNDDSEPLTVDGIKRVYKNIKGYISEKVIKQIINIFNSIFNENIMKYFISVICAILGYNYKNKIISTFRKMKYISIKLTCWLLSKSSNSIINGIGNLIKSHMKLTSWIKKSIVGVLTTVRHTSDYLGIQNPSILDNIIVIISSFVNYFLLQFIFGDQFTPTIAKILKYFVSSIFGNLNDYLVNYCDTDNRFRQWRREHPEIKNITKEQWLRDNYSFFKSFSGSITDIYNNVMNLLFPDKRYNEITNSIKDIPNLANWTLKQYMTERGLDINNLVDLYIAKFDHQSAYIRNGTNGTGVLSDNMIEELDSFINQFTHDEKKRIRAMDIARQRIQDRENIGNTDYFKRQLAYSKYLSYDKSEFDYDENESKFGRGSGFDKSSNAPAIRDYLLNKGISTGGAYGILGNIQAESGFDPHAMEYILASEMKKAGDKYNIGFPPNVYNNNGYRERYTQAIDSKQIPKQEFIYAGPGGKANRGYGLVQFTSAGLKEDLYNNTVEKGISIGSMTAQLDAVVNMLQRNYKKLWNILINPDTSVDQAADAFVRQYERPANVDKTAIDRINFARNWQSKLSGIAPNSTSSTSLISNNTENQPVQTSFKNDNGNNEVETNNIAPISDNPIQNILSKFTEEFTKIIKMAFNIPINEANANATDVIQSNNEIPSKSDIRTSPGGGDPAKLIQIAKGELGTVEDPRNSNHVKYNGNMGNVPWCGNFINWIVDKAGISKSIIPSQTSTAFGYQALLKAGGIDINPNKAKPGDIIYLYDKRQASGSRPGGIFHVGLVQGRSDNKVLTIEGNTSVPGNNGGVAEKARAVNGNIKIVRPKYTEPGDGSIGNINNNIAIEQGTMANTRGSNGPKVFPSLGLYGKGKNFDSRYVTIKTSEGYEKIEEAGVDKVLNDRLRYKDELVSKTNKYGRGIFTEGLINLGSKIYNKFKDPAEEQQSKQQQDAIQAKVITPTQTPSSPKAKTASRKPSTSIPPTTPNPNDTPEGVTKTSGGNGVILKPEEMTQSTSKINSPFGYRIHPIKKVRKLHTGVDLLLYKIARPQRFGHPVKIAADGVVSRVQNIKTGYGNNVIVDHGGGYQTLYAHLNDTTGISKGMKVKAGQAILHEGSSGGSTGPHLHFEVRKNGKPIDPVTGLPQMAQVLGKGGFTGESENIPTNAKMSDDQADFEKATSRTDANTLPAAPASAAMTNALTGGNQQNNNIYSQALPSQQQGLSGLFGNIINQLFDLFGVNNNNFGGLISSNFAQSFNSILGNTNNDQIKNSSGFFDNIFGSIPSIISNEEPIIQNKSQKQDSEAIKWFKNNSNNKFDIISPDSNVYNQIEATKAENLNLLKKKYGPNATFDSDNKFGRGLLSNGLKGISKGLLNGIRNNNASNLFGNTIKMISNTKNKFGDNSSLNANNMMNNMISRYNNSLRLPINRTQMSMNIPSRYSMNINTDNEISQRNIDTINTNLGNNVSIPATTPSIPTANTVAHEMNASPVNQAMYNNTMALNDDFYNRCVKPIVDVLIEVAHNTDKLNIIVKILQDRLGVDIKPSEVANAAMNANAASNLTNSVNSAAQSKYGMGKDNSTIVWDNNSNEYNRMVNRVNDTINGKVDSLITMLQSIASE